MIGIIRGKEHVEIFNRRLDWDVMNKALALLVVSLSYIALVILFLLVLEPFSMEKLSLRLFPLLERWDLRWELPHIYR